LWLAFTAAHPDPDYTPDDDPAFVDAARVVMGMPPLP
jgi:hypothetical protein